MGGDREDRFSRDCHPPQGLAKPVQTRLDNFRSADEDACNPEIHHHHEIGFPVFALFIP
jgi:hypothetical protein